jgi:hypothetical protein
MPCGTHKSFLAAGLESKGLKKLLEIIVWSFCLEILHERSYVAQYK